MEKADISWVVAVHFQGGFYLNVVGYKDVRSLKCWSARFRRFYLNVVGYKAFLFNFLLGGVTSFYLNVVGYKDGNLMRGNLYPHVLSERSGI